MNKKRMVEWYYYLQWRWGKMPSGVKFVALLIAVFIGSIIGGWLLGMATL